MASTDNNSASHRRLMSNFTLLVQLCDKVQNNIQLMREVVTELSEMLGSVEHNQAMVQTTARTLRRQFAVRERVRNRSPNVDTATSYDDSGNDELD